MNNNKNLKNNFNNINVFNNYIFCEQININQTHSSGFLLNNIDNKNNNNIIKGKIINFDNNIKKNIFKKNDIILCSTFSSFKINSLEKKFFFIKVNDVLAKI